VYVRICQVHIQRERYREREREDGTPVKSVDVLDLLLSGLDLWMDEMEIICDGDVQIKEFLPERLRRSRCDL
jgi:hypothetical protein